ncbi:MAG: hypothetical protein U0T84_01315 [Chitinophagales bacterium]
MKRISELKATHGWYIGIASVFMLVLTALAAYFAEARIYFMDMSFQQVLLLADKTFSINYFRPGAIIPQVFPLLAIYAHVPLHSVTIIHSTGMMLFYLALFLFILFYFQNTLFALVLLAYLTVVSNHAFYWCQSEYQQGMAWLCVYGAWLFSQPGDETKFSFRLTNVLLMIWVQFFHPLIVFPMGFMLAYWLLKPSFAFNKSTWFWMLAMVGVFMLRIAVGLLSPYEASHFGPGADFFQHLLHPLQTPSILQFLIGLRFEYAGWLVLYLLGSYLLFIKKSWWRLALQTLLPVGYILFILLCYPKPFAYYEESMLLPAGFMVAIPVLDACLQRPQSPAFAILMTVFLAFRIWAIWETHPKYTNRLTTLKTVVETYTAPGRSKVIVPRQHLPLEELMNNSDFLSYETLLWSTDHQGKGKIVLAEWNPGELQWVYGNTTDMITIWKNRPLQMLDTFYFHLNHDPYIKTE